jgi:epoxyqueuosine reductase
MRESVERRARELGFTLFGVTDARPSDYSDAYRGWLGAGHHGEMAYLSRKDAVERRLDLRGTMDAVRSVVVVGHEYYAKDDPAVIGDPARAVIARYARGKDYHEVVKEKLTELLAWMDGEAEGGVRGRAFVDTAPILEREVAQRAGLGWFGKNTMLIHPRRGSYFLLGTLLVDVDLAPSDPVDQDHCGTCRACLDGCPTGALLGRDDTGAPVIDARRCISYLTIELKGSIPSDLRPLMGNRVFGCDICQEVCPWNGKFAEPSTEPAYEPRSELDGTELIALTDRLLAMSEKGYQREFSDSPLARPRRKGMLRNLCIALGNWGDEEAVDVLARALSDAQPLVREHAAWALGRIGSSDALGALSTRLEAEEDPSVCSEIGRALGR